MYYNGKDDTMPKVLVSDFDNTLYVNDQQIIQNIEKIKKFMSNGNLFIIATGRNYLDISKMILKYNIPYNYLICKDGGTIFDNNGKLLFKKDIPLDVAYDIMDYVKTKNIEELTYIDTGFDYTKVIDESVNAIIIRDINHEKSEKILSELKNKYKEIDGYISDNWININEKTVTKANGIKYLEEKLNLNHFNIFTIGDTINDIPMIKQYTGSCMINSSNDLKQYCTNKFNSVSEYLDYIEKI